MAAPTFVGAGTGVVIAHRQRPPSRLRRDHRPAVGDFIDPPGLAGRVRAAYPTLTQSRPGASGTRTSPGRSSIPHSGRSTSTVGSPRTAVQQSLVRSTCHRRYDRQRYRHHSSGDDFYCRMYVFRGVRSAAIPRRRHRKHAASATGSATSSIAAIADTGVTTIGRRPARAAVRRRRRRQPARAVHRHDRRHLGRGGRGVRVRDRHRRRDPVAARPSR